MSSWSIKSALFVNTLNERVPRESSPSITLTIPKIPGACVNVFMNVTLVGMEVSKSLYDSIMSPSVHFTLPASSKIMYAKSSPGLGI